MYAILVWSFRLSFLALAAAPLDAVLAFGSSGHRIVGELAERALSPAAAAEVKSLLQGELEPTLAGVANWADQLREGDPERGRITSPWHYVNFPHGDCRYSPTRECPDGACVIGALQRNALTLGDRTRPQVERVEALKFLVHFAGDVHQPLHAGYRDDRGGNSFQISFYRDGWNLHSVWDTLIIETRGLDWLRYADALALSAVGKPSKLDAVWRDQAPVLWAEESCRIVQHGGIYPRRHKIKHAYLDEHRVLLERRLMEAGQRLAALLNSVLAAH